MPKTLCDEGAEKPGRSEKQPAWTTIDSSFAGAVPGGAAGKVIYFWSVLCTRKPRIEVDNSLSSFG